MSYTLKNATIYDKNYFMKSAFVILFTLFFIYNPSHAMQQPAKDLELNRRQTAFSERIQSNLRETLSEYYETHTFIVNVKTNLERIPDKVTVQKSETEEMEEQIKLPGLPVAPPVEKKKETKEYVNEQWLFSDRFRVKYIEISVILNELVFKKEDAAFVSKIIKMNSDIDTIRGDVISVSRISFPSGVTPADLKEKKEETQAGILARLKPYIFTALGILLLALIAIALFMIWYLKRTKKAVYEILDEYGMDASGRNNKDTNLLKSDPKPAIPMKERTDAFVEEGQTTDSSNIFYELRQLMVTTLIGNPALSSEIFKKWVDTDKEEGIYKLAAFFKATDVKLIEFMREYLGKELSAKVEFAISQVQSIDKDSLTEVFKKFREEFQNEQSNRMMKAEDEGDDGDIFNFLKKLDSDQLFQLVKDEPIGITAVVLAQTTPECANEVIRNLPDDCKTKIPVEIAKLKKIPVSSYEDIAKKLSKKALEIEKVKYVATDGINVLVEMLDNASPESEEQILQSIAQQDTNLAEELKKVYITFDQLAKLPDKILSNILREFEREVIVKALINSNEEVKGKIIANLASRMKMMVEGELDSKSDDITYEDIMKSRQTITKKFREMAKAGKLDLAKYL